MLLDFGPKDLWAVEIKRSLTPKPEKGFHIAGDDLKVARRLVIYPGRERYRLDKRTEAVPFVGCWELLK